VHSPSAADRWAMTLGVLALVLYAAPSALYILRLYRPSLRRLGLLAVCAPAGPLMQDFRLAAQALRWRTE
jgi:hypothetical protein